jgi:hypothetical protein
MHERIPTRELSCIRLCDSSALSEITLVTKEYNNWESGTDLSDLPKPNRERFKSLRIRYIIHEKDTLDILDVRHSYFAVGHLPRSVSQLHHTAHEIDMDTALPSSDTPDPELAGTTTTPSLI